MAARLENMKVKVTEAVEIPILTRCCFCVPLRKGLISYAYINLILTAIMVGSLGYFVAYLRYAPALDSVAYARLVVDLCALCLETIMTVMFIFGLHMKKVIFMKIYLYFELVFSFIGLVYSLAAMSNETAREVFIILFQLVMQIYFAILIWSSIVKMQRDGSVKYVREQDSTP